MSWRTFSDWAKQRPGLLRTADRLGRARFGRRLLDRMRRPPPAPCRPDLSGWQEKELAAAWIGHATVLLRVGGMTILTDPVFSDRVGLDLGFATAGPLRHCAPALAMSELPEIDLILVSHAHFDHLDRPTLNRLSKRTPVVTSLNNGDLIRDLGFEEVSELRWGEVIEVGSVRLTARRVRHWGARTFFDVHRGFSGFLLESGRRRVLYAGDTAHCDYFRDVGPVDLAIFGIAAYDPYIQAHATPEQVWEMANDARAEVLMPIHHSTFRLSHEPMDEPIERMLAVAGEQSGRIAMTEIGETWQY